MKLRRLLVILLSLFIIGAGANAALSQESPIDSYPEVCRENWDELGCEYNEDCLCYISPIAQPSAARATSSTSTALYDAPHNTSDTSLAQTYVCRVAMRWWGFDDSICEAWILNG